MQFGSCFLLLATPEDPLGTKMIPAVKSVGYDYAEVSLARLFCLSKADVIKYRKLFDDAGLPIRVFNNGVPTGMCMIAGESLEQQVEVYVEHSIWLAKTLGVDTITMSGPNQKTTPKDVDWNKIGKKRYIEMLRYYADKCKVEGLDVLIEPVNEREQSYIATLASAEEIVSAVQRENIGVVMDYFHFIMQKDSFEDVLRLCSNHTIRHIHFAVPNERTYPVHKNLVLCEKVLKAMLEAGYNGRISIEAFVYGELEQTLRTGLETLREAVR